MRDKIIVKRLWNIAYEQLVDKILQENKYSKVVLFLKIILTQNKKVEVKLKKKKFFFPPLFENAKNNEHSIRQNQAF